MDKQSLRFLEVNETATAFYGYSKKEFKKLTAYDIRIPEDGNKLKEELKTGNYTGNADIRLHKKKDGEIVSVEPYITEIHYKGKEAFLITINNVTEKLRMQQQLLQAELTHHQEINRATMEAQEKNRAEMEGNCMIM